MPVIIQSGWTKGRGRCAHPQRHHGASQSQSPERDVRAICNRRFVRAGRLAASALKTKTHISSLQVQPSVFLASVASLRADTGALIAVLPADRARFKFVLIVKAIRSLFCTFPSIAIQLRQKSFRGCTQGLQFSNLSAGKTGLVVLCDGHTVGRKERACPTRYGSSLTQNRARIA